MGSGGKGRKKARRWHNCSVARILCGWSENARILCDWLKRLDDCVIGQKRLKVYSVHGTER